MNKNFFVVRSNDGWAVKEEGKQAPVAVFPMKEQALKRGMAEAKMSEAELVIEHEDGTSEKISYINQPTV
jgi:hypothetical protein